MDIKETENKTKYIEIYPPKQDNLSIFDKACDYFNKGDFFVDDNTTVVIKKKCKYKKLKRLAIKTQKFHGKFLSNKVKEDKNFYKKYLDKYIKSNKNTILIYSPSQSKIRSIKKIALLSLVLALGTEFSLYFSSFLSSFIPNLYQEIKTRIEVSKYGENKVITDDLIPEKFNQVDTIENITETIKNGSVQLDSDSIEAINFLTQDLNELLKKYSNSTEKLTPSFLSVEYTGNETPTQLKIFCDLGSDKVTYFVFKIKESEIETFNSLFNNSPDTQVSDAINKLSQFLMNKDISDLPSIYSKITVNNIDYYPSGIKREFYPTEWSDDLGDFIHEDSYSFKYLHTVNSTLYETKIHISAEKAKTLEGFDAKNPATLYDLYRDDSSNFSKDYEIEQSHDQISKILMTAKNQRNFENNNFEK